MSFKSVVIVSFSYVNGFFISSYKPPKFGIYAESTVFTFQVKIMVLPV